MCLAFLLVLEDGHRSKKATISDVRQCVTRIQCIVLDGE
jgi:hypothetical protein